MANKWSPVGIRRLRSLGIGEADKPTRRDSSAKRTGKRLWLVLLSNDHIHDNERQTPSPPPLPSISTHIVLPNFRPLLAITDPLPAHSLSSLFTGFPVLAGGYTEDVHIQLYLPCPKPVFNIDLDLSGERCHRRIPLCRN